MKFMWKYSHEIVYVHRGFRPLFVIPHEKVREDVEEIVGNDASIVFITTPGQVTLLFFLYKSYCTKREKGKARERHTQIQMIENLL